ncbi:MAG TPA: SigE family RNA polymerase sigma factor [Propionibacteriaceae bacterium]|nr:SigE family RNA polymerase sigma factor [Propionibacteriaceae bacterium]
MSDADFEAFLAVASPGLLRTATLLAGSRTSGEDLLQDALARTYRHWGHIADGHPEAYVRTTMVHLQSSWWRRRWSGELPSANVPERETPDAADAQVADRVSLERALASLPLAQRQVVVLRYVDDLSLAEVAEAVGRPQGTVKSQAARGLERLRQVLTHDADLVGSTTGGHHE